MADRPRGIHEALADLRAAVGRTPEHRALARFNGWLSGPAWRRWMTGAVVLAIVGAVLIFGMEG